MGPAMGPARTGVQPMQPLVQVCFLCILECALGLALAPGSNDGNAQDCRIAGRLAGTKEKQKVGMYKFQGAFARQRTGIESPGLLCAWQRGLEPWARFSGYEWLSGPFR
jgi:hypothetical protein